MEKFLQLNCKLRRNKASNGYALTIFFTDKLLEACKELKIIDDS